MSKPRIVKDYEKLPDEVVARLKVEYPLGFAQNLVAYNNKEGKRISALPFETDEVYYLIKMNEREAVKIIEEDDDYDDDGKLRDDYEVDGLDEEDGDIADVAEAADVKEEEHSYDDDEDGDVDGDDEDEDDDDR